MSIVVYGTEWCGDTRRSRRLLEKQKIEYTWIDIDEDREGERFVVQACQGRRSVPTIILTSGRILVEPSDAALLAALKEAGITEGQIG
jgi:mycoredoxin